MKSSLENGTAYLSLSMTGKKSTESLPIDDAFWLLDQTDNNLVGFGFHTDAENASNWKECWKSLPGGFNGFIKILAAQYLPLNEVNAYALPILRR